MLELPSTATQEDLRQMIGGRLSEMDKNPMNVQVLVHPSADLEDDDSECSS